MSTEPAFAVRPARASDLQQAIVWLQASGLPTVDLDVQHLAFVAERESRLLGVIGVERYRDKALVRSLVVDDGERGLGIGPRLLAALETSCVAEEILELWLLTIDQRAFFEKHGFTTQPRSAAPDVIRSTREFSGLCPDDATLMSKRL